MADETYEMELSISQVYNELQDLKKELKRKVTVPIGTILPYGGTKENIPTGWLFCDGKELSRGEYEALYNVISIAFGASDVNKFNLPDLRGRFVRGVDDGQQRDPDAEKRGCSSKGGNTGDKVGSVQEDAIKSHDLTYKASHAGQVGGQSKFDPPAIAGWPINSAKKTISYDGAQETRPKNIYLNWIIKAKDAD